MQSPTAQERRQAVWLRESLIEPTSALETVSVRVGVPAERGGDPQRQLALIELRAPAG